MLPRAKNKTKQQQLPNYNNISKQN